MNRKALLLGLVGLAIFSALFVGRSLSSVLDPLREAGWRLVPIALWHLVPLAFDTLAWHSVIRGEAHERPGLLALFRIRWTAESVNALLPVLSIGGEVYKVAALTRHGVGVARGAAALVVDMTQALLSEILFVACGVAALWSLRADAALPPGLAEGIVVAGALAVVVLVVQRGRVFGTAARVLARVGLGSALLHRLGDLDALDAEVHALHARPARLVRCFLARLAAWVLGTGEVWLGLRVLDHPVSLAEAFVLESLCQAVRTAGFMIPGALGVQEGGYVLFGRLFGLDEGTALALSLARRVRDLVLGIPALAAWQLGAGRRAFEDRGDRAL